MPGWGWAGEGEDSRAGLLETEKCARVCKLHPKAKGVFCKPEELHLPEHLHEAQLGRQMVPPWQQEPRSLSSSKGASSMLRLHVVQ